MAKRTQKQKKTFSTISMLDLTWHRYNYVTLRKINIEKFTRINTLPRIIFIKEKKKKYDRKKDKKTNIDEKLDSLKKNIK